jgi:uncharacterized membrane protein YbhN (UPF0104 family)
VKGIGHAAAETARRLAQARPQYLFAALALYIVSLFIVGARWRGFLRAIGGDVGLGRAALATLGGIAAGNLTPSMRLAGEACRIAIVRATGRASWRHATIAAMWDRLSEVPPVLVLVIIAIIGAGHRVTSWRLVGKSGVAMVLLAAAVAIGLVWAAAKHARAQLAALHERLSGSLISGRVFATGVALSTLLWIQDVLRLTCAALAFGVALSPTAIATLAVVAMIGGIVPGIGGLGPVEGGLVGTLLAFGVDLPTAVAITSAERAISFGFSTASGATVIALSGGGAVWRAARTRSLDYARIRSNTEAPCSRSGTAETMRWDGRAVDVEDDAV